MKPALTMALLRATLESLDHLHTDNWEPRRGPKPRDGTRLGRLAERVLARFGYTRFRRIKSRAQGLAKSLERRLPDYEQAYAALADEASRQVMVEQLAYRLLGHERVRLSYPTEDYHAQLERLDAAAEPVSDAWVDVGDGPRPLSRFDLNPWGLPIRLLARPLGVYTIFVAHQYSYDRGGRSVAAGDGDTVLDLGGSYGDTALYFANRVGPEGRVFVWEFLPSSLKLMRRNLDLNPQLRDRIRPLRHAAWHRSGEKMYFADRGPATRVEAALSDACPDEVETLSIDDLVAREGLQVDFIKMDVEGAELQALRGAEAVLRSQRPTLALSVYHRFADLADIPRFLLSLDLGYRFYLRSSTTFGAELILFAQADR